jgi:hypothetical protein
MELFADAGGAPLPLEGTLLVGGIYLILPLVALLLGLSWVFFFPRCARVALLLAGLPLLLLIPMVASYEPSDHEYDQSAQIGGRMAVCLYGLLTVTSLGVMRASRSPKVVGHDAAAEIG